MGLQTMVEWLSRRLRGPEKSALELLVGQDDYHRVLLLMTEIWAGSILGGTVISILVDGSHVPSFHRGPALIVLGISVVFSLGVVVARAHPSQLMAVEIPGVAGAILGAILFGLFGPLHQEAAAFIPAYAATTFLMTTRRLGFIITATLMLGYVVVVARVHGFVDPVLRVGVITSLSLPTAWVMSWTVGRVQRLAARERESAAEVTALAAELADANQWLEERVAEQVERIDSLGRLERFLSPQVAQAVLSSSNASLLEPHRRQIAVLFCDLRGFTAFTAAADPEEVVEILGGYYDAAGELIEQHDATLGSFEGDGIMAYFNDPFPCEDPPWEAVSMAQELRHALRTLQLRWEAKGFHLGFGIGIGWGYATLGTFGFKGRSDYTALGTVVNLASRLCGQAGDGEILLDPRAHEAVLDRVRAERVDVELKGFRGPVHAYQL